MNVSGHWEHGPVGQTIRQTVVQPNGQTEQTLRQTLVQTVGQAIRQTVVKINGQTEQTLGQTIVQTVGQTIRQTVVQTIGQTEQILGQTISQTHINVYKHPIKFIIFSFHFFEWQMNMKFWREIFEKNRRFKDKGKFQTKVNEVF